MEIKKFLLLLVVTVILSSLMTSFFYSLLSYNNKIWYRDVRIKEIDMDLIVTSNKRGYGINIDTDAFHFGKLPRGAGATRHLNVTNSHNFRIFFYVAKDDSKLSEIVAIGPNKFILKPYERRKINVAVRVPKGFEPGNYSGKVDLVVRVPFFRERELKRSS